LPAQSPWSEAVSSWNADPLAFATSGKAGWYSRKGRLSHIPTQVATLLVTNGDDVKTVQESLRHANSKVTLDLCAQAVTPAKRKAQSKIVQMLIRVKTTRKRA